MFFVYTHCKYGEIGVTEISKSVEEFKKSYEESKSYLEYFGYTFSIAYIAAIGYLSPYTAAASFTLGSFKDYFNNVKILEKESYEIEFSLFDLLHNTTTSLTFYNIANFTEGKLKPYNNNSGNKIFKTVSLCVKTALDVTNAVFIQKDAYTEIGEKTNEALFKDVNNKKNILKTDFTKTSAKITAKSFLI